MKARQSRTRLASCAAAAAALAVTAAALAPAVGLAQPSAADAGKDVYDQWCTPCHGAGPGKPGTMVLEQRYAGRLPALLEERTDLTSATITTFVRGGVGVMPPFRKTEITDSELAAMIRYLTGDRAAGRR